ncbi:MAG TPA: hypothetical protein VIK56_16725 [Rhodoferax sp.]
MSFEETGKLFNIAIAREIEANDFYAKAAKTALDASVRAIHEDRTTGHGVLRGHGHQVC